ncbi:MULTISPECIES: DsbA family oxidoreductase [Sphingobacterium]|uniref:DsbA family oxidoreductase n=1 Tax=Sphingobacterium TaxID=28453 RepID=UPI001044351C|nr:MULTISPECIES: DsbA family oxidoreductase [Sphingobacterium]MCW2259474.1 putative DsbA family dithiol-disulfide isomerase [Sphingobacterium kitahiroshimense]TCR14079.1 putative DsbA family dithiol-disulfide isomerase [Sphingobacterium sp. JUb78]
MKIQVWSDIMCPFCYIAKKNFEQALAGSSFKDEVEVEWKSFQLDPTLKESSGTLSISEYMMNRKGFSKAHLDQFLNQLKEMGKNAGVTFNYDQAIAADTFPAHKLLHLAKEHGKADEMEEALFKAHFVDGKNIADVEFLVSFAEELGLDPSKARKVLAEDEYNYEVKQDIMEAQNLGITGVPYYLLDGKYAVSGAQPVELFAKALAQTYQESIVDLSEESGDNMCGIDGCSI